MEPGVRPLTHADVERIVRLAEDSTFGLVRFEADGIEIELVKEGYEPPTGASDVAASPAPPVSGDHLLPGGGTPASATGTRPPATVAAVAAEPTTAPAGQAATADPADVAVDGVMVHAPMVGIFYRAPDPESPPYVEVGDVVEPGATVGLVEVMKMFTAIRAEVGGRVAEILTDNAVQVDRGQALIRLVEA